MSAVTVSCRQGLLDIKEQIARLRDEQQAIAMMRSRFYNPGANMQNKYIRLHRKKRRMYLKQRGKCCFCKVKMYACFETSPSVGIAATFEHKTPKSKGGKEIILSCHRCNKIRGTVDYDQFALIVSIVPYEDLRIAVESRKYRVKHGLPVRLKT